MSLYNYIEEHYRFQDTTLAEKLYREYLTREQFTIIERPYGFIVYKFQGDACIIQDIYTTDLARKQGKAWDLFKLVKNEINKHNRCNVIIGFSEHGGVDNQHGIGAMLAAGFIPAYELKERTVYVRGI